MTAPTTDPAPGLPLRDIDGFTHRWVVTADATRVHAVEGGRADGPTIVLLAGFPQTLYAWHRVLPRLAARFHLIALDLPGQGHSDRPRDHYATHIAAGTIHEALHTLGAEKYWLVGHDIGAWVAFALALDHQESLHGLVLVDAGIPGVSLPDAVPTDPERARKTWHFAFHVVPDLPETLLAGRERTYVEWFLTTKSLDPQTFDAAEVDHYAASLAADGGLRASLGYYRSAADSARHNRDAVQALPGRRLQVPVLGVSGSHGSIPDMAATLGAWAADVTGTVVAGSGHFIPDEQPDALADAVATFVEQPRGRRARPQA